jgi:Flp pilus assembly pilin Flp
MHQLFTTARRFVSRDDGQDLMEYGLLMALIAVVAIAAVSTLGTFAATFWSTIAQNV